MDAKRSPFPGGGIPSAPAGATAPFRPFRDNLAGGHLGMAPSAPIRLTTKLPWADTCVQDFKTGGPPAPESSEHRRPRKVQRGLDFRHTVPIFSGLRRTPGSESKPVISPVPRHSQADAKCPSGQAKSRPGMSLDRGRNPFSCLAKPVHGCARRGPHGALTAARGRRLGRRPAPRPPPARCS
jgi:hypothetical protein